MDSSSAIAVHIDRLSRKGRGIGLGKRGPASMESPIEVIGSVPQDYLLVELGKKRKGKIQGTLQEILTPSPFRVVPRCSHVPFCGGCSLQSMDYQAQLEEKQKLIATLFAPLSPKQIDPILPCEEIWRYRNKMEFSFSQNRAGEKFLGLILAGSKGKVLNLQECHLVNPWFIQVLKGVYTFWQESPIEAYRLNDTGSLRTLTLREGIGTGHKMVFLTVSGNPAFAIKKPQLDQFIQAVKDAIPEEEHPFLSIFLRIQQVKKGFPTQFFEMHLHGPDHILETLHIQNRSLQFKISPTSFFQPNTLQAQRLYSKALSLIPTGCKHLLDLYAGTATLSLVCALQAEQVTAIEINPHAIFDAPEQHGNERDRQCPLYISCNPATQAANTQEFIQAGYLLDGVYPIDQFPHTFHIENIAFFKRI
ncbi:MAG: class I SAM-dependent RNA methyltransferase [Chlamydiales bacterium]|nr:class I SAM-dependent RNA methyltransferase [Chlamydiales bacterium]